MKTSLNSARPLLAALAMGSAMATQPVLRAAAVSTLADDGLGSLRVAISIAINNEVITFDPSAGRTLTLTSGQYDIRTNLTIQGLGAKGLSVDANNQSRIFYVHSAPTNVNISGLTLKNSHVISDTIVLLH